MARELRYDQSFYIQVDTPAGLMVRTVRAMADVPVGTRLGDAAEDAARNAAAQWGMPDFVFRGRSDTTGSGVRELGDMTVVVANYAAAIQVKAREGDFSDQAKEEAWLRKRILKAHKQAKGTMRRLHQAGRVTLTNERNREVEVDFRSKDWLSVVILDHPGREDFTPDVDSLVLLRSDWEFLFEQLKSTYAVLDYLNRVRPDKPVRLGREALRYYEYAAADLVSEPSVLPAEYQAMSPSTFSAPWAPQAPAGHNSSRFHQIIRVIMEDVANSPKGDEINFSDLNEVLAVIDQVPVGMRAELGETILEWLEDVAAAPEGVKWRARRVLRPGYPQFILAAATSFNEEVQAGFTALVRLRHQQVGEKVPEAMEMFSVGVLLTPRYDGLRGWDTTLSATIGDQKFTADYRGKLEQLWPSVSF